MPPRKIGKNSAAATPSSSSRVQWNPALECLHEHPKSIRPALYLSLHPSKSMLIEYTMDRRKWEGYNIVETFDRYGWGGVCDFDNTKVFIDVVREWMITMRNVGAGEQMKLVGTFRDQVVEVTVPNIRRLYGVDTGYYMHRQNN